MALQGRGFADEDRGLHLAATYIAGCAVTFVFVLMRLCARYSIAGVGMDDWCMLITWLVFLPCTILVTIFSLNGGTKHLAHLAQDLSHMRSMLRLNWLAQPLAIFCLGASKIAVALLILRLLHRKSTWRRWTLYLSVGITGINTILMIVFTFAQCEDPAALWDDDVKQRTRCWDPSIQSRFSIYGASMHAVVDFLLALLPITLVWKVNATVRKRLALCALLGCGSLTGICASVKATKLMSLNARSDLTWETFDLFMWTGIEIILSIICGSVPALKPVYAICMGRRSNSQRYDEGTRLDSQDNSRYDRDVEVDEMTLGTAEGSRRTTRVIIGSGVKEIEWGAQSPRSLRSEKVRSQFD